MFKTESNKSIRLAGYAALIKRYGLEVVPNWHESRITAGTTHRIDSSGSVVREDYPSRYWPGDGLGDHLEFALKYDGTNLAVLAVLFRESVEAQLLEYIRSKPTGKYSRRLWFLYEFLTNKELPLDDLKQGSYIDLIDPDQYYTLPTPSSRKVDNQKKHVARLARRVPRQKVYDNLLGNGRFCPMIRRTGLLRRYETDELPKRCQEVVSGYSPELLERALGYLYTKETRSSFEIERIKPSSTRTERFISLLKLAELEDFCQKDRLIELQNHIVDPRFRDSDYRSSQNYVGETINPRKERIHFVSPKPRDLTGLMDGLISSHRRMNAGGVSAVIHAAAISYGFVFLHPFEDGNGRIHRFLIHNILARQGFTPEGIMFPVSATMLKELVSYDASLEEFSRKLMPLVKYFIDVDGRLTVHNDTAIWYRYIDMTFQAEVLFDFIKQTIETELADELEFLEKYDRTKKAVQEVVDMPDRQIDIFINTCMQNGGRISLRKRKRFFSKLLDEEIVRIEKVFQDNYAISDMSEKS